MNEAVSQAQVLYDSGEIEAAAAGFKEALKRSPGDLAAAKGLGRSLDWLRRFDEAFEAWSIAVAIAPSDVMSRYAIAEAWHRRGEVSRARSLFEALCAEHPGNYPAQTMALLSLLYSESDDNSELVSAQKHWGCIRAPSSETVFNDYGADKDPERPLRIGFVSSDFRAHSVGFNLLPIFLGLDRCKFSAHAYAQLRTNDPMSEKFRASADSWCDISEISDLEAAESIHKDNMDILVLLAGHVDENRPFIARHRPAPIQISHHDICTSAIPEMDYWIGDPVVSPRGGAEFFSERVLRIPSFTVQPIPAEAPGPSEPPALKNNYITFGSFNAPQKITKEVIEIWSKILLEVSGSRLVLKYFDAFNEDTTRQRLLDLFGANGVDANRVEFVAPTSYRADHLNAYSRVDIALDPFPFGGATTTFEALLMGTPVITLMGERFTGRCAAATLEAVGLSVCVATDTSDYIGRAVVLAQDPQRLSPLRQTLPNLLRRSRICNTERHVRNLQRVYRAVWRRYCAT